MVGLEIMIDDRLVCRMYVGLWNVRDRGSGGQLMVFKESKTIRTSHANNAQGEDKARIWITCISTQIRTSSHLLSTVPWVASPTSVMLLSPDW